MVAGWPALSTRLGLFAVGATLLCRGKVTGWPALSTWSSLSAVYSTGGGLCCPLALARYGQVGGRVACIVKLGWTFVQQGQLCHARVRWQDGLHCQTVGPLCSRGNSVAQGYGGRVACIVKTVGPLCSRGNSAALGYGGRVACIVETAGPLCSRGNSAAQGYGL